MGTALTVVPPVWDMPDVTTTYQWLRDGRTITGATGNVYELTTADYPLSVSVRATGTRSGYLPGTSTSIAMTVTPGVPLVATSPPVLSGTFRYGQTVATTAGTWPGTPRFSYQWLRDGRAITGATRSTYRIVGADVGHRLSSRVTGSLTGYAPGARSSATRTVPKLGSVVAATAARVKTGKRGTVAVTVTVVGLTPTGRITVVEGRRTLVTKTLTAPLADASASGSPSCARASTRSSCATSARARSTPRHRARCGSGSADARTAQRAGGGDPALERGLRRA